MELGSPGGTYLRLNIVGYQFPAMGAEPYDSNWLNIKLRATGPFRTWSAIDAALLTYEAKQLEAWFRGLATQRPSDRTWSALEPNLWMEWEPLGTTSTLRVGFGAGFLPPTFDKAVDSTPDNAFMDLVVDSVALTAAADSLQSELARFPQRAPV